MHVSFKPSSLLHASRLNGALRSSHRRALVFYYPRFLSLARHSPAHPMIQSKVCSLTRHTSAPIGLYCIPLFSLPSHSFLSSSYKFFITYLSMAQSRSFATVGPSSWNGLSQSIRANLFSVYSDQLRKCPRTSL